MSQQHTVLLYYKYIPVEQPKKLLKQQRELCERLDLKGRILISDEGINGTLAGLPEAVAEYQQATMAVPEFSDMEWKTSRTENQVFPKLKVKYRPEIVTLGIKKTGTDVSLSNKAHYIEPEELMALYDNEEEFLILDARNEYEARIGKFKNALIPPIDAFREFPEFVKENLADYKDKPVVTYCTGGVRCEKASAFLREQGFSNVRQLHGGVHVYAEKTGGKHFEGELFVFDDRLHMPVNAVNPSVISKCQYCSEPTTRLVDCAEHACGELFICCESCQGRYDGTCSAACQEKHRKSLQN